MAAQKVFCGICVLIFAMLACSGVNSRPNIQETIEAGAEETLDANSAAGTTISPSSEKNTAIPSDIGTPDTSSCGDNWKIVITSVEDLDVGDGTRVVLVTLGLENNTSYWGQLKGPDDDWLSNGSEPTTYLTTKDGSTYPYIYGILPIPPGLLPKPKYPINNQDTGWISTPLLPPGFVTLGFSNLNRPYYYNIAFQIPIAEVPDSITIGGMYALCINSNSSGDLPVKTYRLNNDITSVRAQPSPGEYPELVGSKIDLPDGEGTIEFTDVTRDGNRVSVIFNFTNLSSYEDAPRFNGYIVGDSLLTTCQFFVRFLCDTKYPYSSVDISPVPPGQTQSLNWLLDVPEDETNLLFVYVYDVEIDVPNIVYRINPEIVSSVPSEVSDTADLCNNDYYPVVQGARWEYKATNMNMDGTGVETVFYQLDEIVEVLADRFYISHQFSETGEFVNTNDPSALRNEWLCLPDGLLYLFSSDTKGVTVPKQMPAGYTWEITRDLGYKETFISFGIMSVAVPAGVFDAVLVNSYIDGMRDMGTKFEWYAPGVGWVRGEYDIGINKTIYELQAYSIP